MKKLKKIEKKIVFGALFCVFAGAVSFAQSESSLAFQMQDAYDSGFYPGVVLYADQILNSESKSVYEAKAMVFKGESLFKMGRIKDSLEILSDAEKSAKNSPELNSARCFWTGRGLFELNKNEAALPYFYKSAEILKNAGLEKTSVYSQAILYSGKTLVRLKNFEAAAECFEYAVQNGKKFSAGEYEEACVNFFENCVLAGNFKKCEEYFVQLEKLGQIEKFVFSQEAKYRILLAYGQALENLGKFSACYDCYVKVLTEGPSSLAALAMQKAYLLSSAHQNQIKKDPAEVIEKAELLKKEKPELVSEFWTRLAIDAFNSKKYEKSLSYFKNAEKNNSAQLKQLALLYSAEISFLTSKEDLKTAAKNSLEIINSGWNECGFEKEKFYYSDAIAAKTRYFGLSEDWENSLKNAQSQILSENSSAAKKTLVYWAALSQYSLKNYEGALDFLNSENYSDDEFLFLKAKIFAKMGRSSDADSIFYALSKKGFLDNDGRLDYIRTLLNAGHLISTVEEAENAHGSESDYMKALALFNPKNWQEAEKYFEESISDKKFDSKYSNLAKFYLGYCQYQLGKYKNALENLESFVKNSGENALNFQALATAAKCAAQIQNYPEAEKNARNALSSSKNQEQKNESVLLLAGIYSDSKKYDEAIKLLKSYSSEKNSFGFECRYLMAQFFVQNKDFVQADKTYSELSEEKNAGFLAEESVFRRGELFYVNENYEKSVQLFEIYLKKYQSGKFYPAALYFEADSLFKIGRIEKSSLYFMEIVEKPENSSYKYDSEKKLIDIYRSQKKYSQALKIADKMLLEYGNQAEKDGISSLKRELQALSSGADREIFEKEQEFESAGGSKTKNGRKIGTELAKIYFEKPQQKMAESLARELFEIQKNNDDEIELAGKNAVLLADILRSQNKNDEAADMFLSAAEFGRKCGNSEIAERSLYGAAEAFDAAGKKADALSTAKVLINLYPKSQYAADVQRIVNLKEN